MKKIVTIWWWNWHSSVLKWIYNKLKINNNFWDFQISSIVSMSDDGRTTWLLMREMSYKLWIHMPPPWDLRRCLFSFSSSIYREKLENILELVIDFDWNISDFSLKNILENIWNSAEIIKLFEKHDNSFLDFVLPLDCEIRWHKFWNLLMAIVYYNFWDYNKMMNFMHNILEVKAEILPVTTDKAFIYAELENGEIIETQDNISNVSNYNSAIKKIDLMSNSSNAKLNEKINKTILDADFIIICPWDLYTSIDANFIIPWFEDLVQKSSAKKIYLLNQCNKKWETTNYTELDFLDLIQKRLWNKLDIVFANEKLSILDDSEKKLFSENISVKWWNYLFIDENKKQEIIKKYNFLEIISWDYLDKKSLYKNNQKMIDDLIDYIKK